MFMLLFPTKRKCMQHKSTIRKSILIYKEAHRMILTLNVRQFPKCSYERFIKYSYAKMHQFINCSSSKCEQAHKLHLRISLYVLEALIIIIIIMGISESIHIIFPGNHIINLIIVIVAHLHI